MTAITDPLIGFGSVVPPRVGRWSPDVLGAGFSAQALQLLPDEEGEVLATLVRYSPPEDPAALTGTPATPFFIALYLHGWNDYFFQRELARQVALAGGAFFALDLRKYGRSWRKNQTFGWVRDLSTYDEEIEEALVLIEGELRRVGGAVQGSLPVVLMAHSTGGLTAALWAHRHPGRLAGLWLNSPWLELQMSALMRYPAQQMVELLGAREPRRPIPTGGKDFYSTSLAGWQELDGPLPADWEDFKADPAITGWGVNPVWKASDRVTYAGWLAAVTAGHRQVSAGLSIDCPVLLLASRQSFKQEEWDLRLRSADAVLDADVIVQRAVNLGSHVCVERFNGVHDLTLSIPPVRREVWSVTLGWLRWRVFGGRGPCDAESAEFRKLRVPRVEDVQLAPR